LSTLVLEMEQVFANYMKWSQEHANYDHAMVLEDSNAMLHLAEWYQKNKDYDCTMTQARSNVEGDVRARIQAQFNSVTGLENDESSSGEE
jgi:hypothetical protein